MELDGSPLGAIPEHPRQSTSFTCLDRFPAALAAGVHTLTLKIRCSEPMPLLPINIHLHDRTVGCIAYIQGDGFWLPTDATWQADDGQAEVVCRLGEEPYGELDNTPDWFVAGGYGDIAAEPMEKLNCLSASGLEANVHGGRLILTGSGVRKLQFGETNARNERYIFYHLMKQNEWKALRSQQNARDWTDMPKTVVEFPSEMNIRFHIENRGLGEVEIVWNGAESLHELHGYDSCITERAVVKPGSRFVTSPQGMKLVQFLVGAGAGESFHLEIRFEAVGVPMKQVGRLECDNPLLKKIYDVSVHTSAVCHQIGLWDGIKRDRLNWAYDIYMAAKADYVLWDDLSVLRRSIRELGKTPYGYWMNAIPSYTLWWLCGVWDYYLETGDTAFVLELREDLTRHLRWVEENTDKETGLFLPGARAEVSFIEWVPIGADESWWCLNAIYKLMKTQIGRLAAYVPELGIEVTGEGPELPEYVFLEGTSALLTPLLGIMSGSVAPDKAEAFLRSCELKDPLTPLSAYWFAECCSRHGLHEKAWDAISLVWGSMLNSGATTFWESIVLNREEDYHAAQTTYTAYGSYRMSLCHSWSSTPVVWISRYILGIQPLEPGYRKFDFTPNALPGLTECKGGVGTPDGPILVEWKVTEGGINKSVSRRTAGGMDLQ
ncbi:alpha-L-rhamnosidase C-terminal domain-containing protein [Paenibacillus sp. HJGM_3]|uniref:alpha-L-rhamnosidase-related protein n=1 Tax=Paenibacillus sp. HJGM_3 TaxID=3379816 RepID=UPI00385C6BB1